MPTAVTHQLIARQVFLNLPEKAKDEITSFPLFELGAQGGDVLFFFRPFNRRNLGRALHAEGVFRFFHILKEESERDSEVLSYACGYLTHYAADVCFHPDIYKRLGKGNRFLLHHAIEHAYDGEFLKERGKSLFSYALLKPEVPLSGVCRVFKRYAKEKGLTYPNEEEFCRAVDRYYFFSSKRFPFYRARLAVDAKGYFERATKEGERLLRAFLKGELDKKSFSRHLLTGKEEG